MNIETKEAIIKALNSANLNELYKKGIGISADEAGFYDDLYPMVFDLAKNKISFLRTRSEETESLILLGNYSANDILHNDPISLIHEMLNDED